MQLKVTARLQSLHSSVCMVQQILSTCCFHQLGCVPIWSLLKGLLVAGFINSLQVEIMYLGFSLSNKLLSFDCFKGFLMFLVFLFSNTQEGDMPAWIFTFVIQGTRSLNASTPLCFLKAAFETISFAHHVQVKTSFLGVVANITEAMIDIR